MLPEQVQRPTLRGHCRRGGGSRAPPGWPRLHRGALWLESERSEACFRCRSSPAGRAKGFIGGVEAELLAGAVCAREPARSEPLGQGEGTVAITERGDSTDTQSEHHDHYHQSTCDQNKEHHYLRLRNREGVRSTLQASHVARSSRWRRAADPRRTASHEPGPRTNPVSAARRARQRPGEADAGTRTRTQH
jgi:hypothetical protein